MFDVVVYNDKGDKLQGLRVPITECGIGKARDNLIQLRGWRIAGHHAELQQNGEGIFIEDKSGHGNTMVNGKPIDRYGPLRSADKIQIGSFVITAGWDEGFVDTDIDDDVDDVKTMIGVPRHTEIKEDSTLLKKDKFMWRNRVHQELLQAMDLRRTDVGGMDEAQLRKHVEKLIRQIIADMGSKLPADVDREKLAVDVLNEAVGLGPLEELIADDDITEIMLNK
ncbi:MAG: FHA domain-containing protein, partial [Haliea sp.]